MKDNRAALSKDWKNIAKKAWSFRLGVLAGLLTACEVILPLYIDAVPRNLFAILSIVTITAAMVARLVAQKDME